MLLLLCAGVGMGASGVTTTVTNPAERFVTFYVVMTRSLSFDATMARDLTFYPAVA